MLNINLLKAVNDISAAAVCRVIIATLLLAAVKSCTSEGMLKDLQKTSGMLDQMYGHEVT